MLSGRGEAFCAGHDLAAFAAWPQAPHDPVPRFLHAIARFEKPLVAAVQGSAVGIGATMLLHADWVVAAPDARLRFPFIDLGIAPEAASTLLLPLVVGASRARRLLLGGAPFSGEDAHRWGLVAELRPAVDLVEAALERGRLLAAKAPGPFGRIKRWLASDAAIHARIDEEVEAINAAIEARRAAERQP